MYGVSDNLDLSAFEGAILEQICLGEFYLQLRFRSLDGESLEVGIESGWQLRDESGALLDAAVPNSERDCYRLHLLLGKTVTATGLDAPHSFSLAFTPTGTLTVFDDSTESESFSIQPGDIFV